MNLRVSSQNLRFDHPTIRHKRVLLVYPAAKFDCVYTPTLRSEVLPVVWISNLHHLTRWYWKMRIDVERLVNLLLWIFLMSTQILKHEWHKQHEIWFCTEDLTLNGEKDYTSLWRLIKLQISKLNLFVLVTPRNIFSIILS